jgi:enoyl-CoA hydratase
MLLGSRIDAARADALGLVNRVVPRAELDVAALTLAESLSEAAPLAVRAIKRAVRDGLTGNLDQALERERSGQLELLASADAREGVTAFLSRRRPQFSGR